jgi:hypothetical protein
MDMMGYGSGGNMSPQQQKQVNPSNIDPLQLIDEEIGKLYHYSNPQNLQPQFRNSPEARDFMSNNRKQLMDMLTYRKQVMQLKQQEDYNQGRLNLEQQKLDQKYPQQNQTNRPTRQNVASGFMDIGGQRTYFPQAGTVNTTQDKRAWNQYYAGQSGLPKEYTQQAPVQQYTPQEALTLAKIEEIRNKDLRAAEKHKNDLKLAELKYKNFGRPTPQQQASMETKQYKAKGQYDKAKQTWETKTSQDKIANTLDQLYNKYKGQNIELSFNSKGMPVVKRASEGKGYVFDENLLRQYKEARMNQLRQEQPDLSNYYQTQGLPPLTGFFKDIDFTKGGFNPNNKNVLIRGIQ